MLLQDYLITKLFRTSSRCSICLHPQIFETCKVRVPRKKKRLPRHKWAEIMVQYGRPRGSSRTKSVRTPVCRPLAGKTVRGSSLGTRMGKCTRFLMFLRSPKNRLSLSVHVDDIKMAGGQRTMAPMYVRMCIKSAPCSLCTDVDVASIARQRICVCAMTGCHSSFEIK